MGRTAPTRDQARIGANGLVPEDESKDAQSRVETARLGEEILSMISNLSCEQDADCKRIHFGYNPCGPAGYIIYSSKTVDETALKAKAALYTEQRKAETPEGATGICGFASPMIPECRPSADTSLKCQEGTKSAE